jgi:hypothetical protein
MLLFLPFIAIGRGFGITVYGGGSPAFSKPNDGYFTGSVSQWGYLAGLEAKYLTKDDWLLGIGVSTEQLSISSKKEFERKDYNGNVIWKGRLKMNIASPAMSVYALFGKLFTINKLELIPQFTIGYVKAIEHERSGSEIPVVFSYGNGTGFHLGLTFSANYKLTSGISAGIRTGVTNYTITHHLDWSSTTTTVPFAVNVSCLIRNTAKKSSDL